MGENILGVALAALMQVPPERRAWLKEQAFQRVYACRENNLRRFLLFECVDAYLPLEGPQLHEFETWLSQDTNQGVQAMATTLLGASYERGLQEGLLQGQRQAVQTLLEARFGPLSPTARRRLESLPAERLNQLLLAVLTAQSLQELELEE